MVNPTKDKFRASVLDYHFYELMRIYSNALERENSLLFVMGFSFADDTLRKLRNVPLIQIQHSKLSFSHIVITTLMRIKTIWG